MANVCDSVVYVTGKKEDLIAFVNLALRNSGIEETTEDVSLKFAVDYLSKFGKYKFGASLGEMGDENRGMCEIRESKGLAFSTWFPIPETFLKYDTTNYADRFMEESKFQKDTYGVVGWYDYNRENFGVKWDCVLNYIRTDGKSIIFDVETPWNLPMVWLRRLSKEFKTLKFFYCTLEEFGQICEYGSYKDGEVEVFDCLDLNNDDEEMDMMFSQLMDRFHTYMGECGI